MKGVKSEVTLDRIKDDLVKVKKHVDSIPFTRYEAMPNAEKDKLRRVNEKIQDTLREIDS